MRRKIFASLFTLGIFCAVAVRAQEEEEAPAAEGETAPDDGAETEAEGGPADDGHYTAIETFLNGTTSGNLVEKIGAFYAKDARYEDPFGEVTGRIEIERRFERWFADLETVSFQVKEVFASGDETVALWTMELKHKKIGGGDPVSVDGASQFRFAGEQVVYHRSYYDAGALVYEHVTFVGWLVKWVKKKVAGV